VSHLTIPLTEPSLLRTQAYIDGQWTDADDGATLEIKNPADGKTIAHVAKVGAVETRRAIAAAERAQCSWRQTTAKERAGLMRKWFELMLAAQEDLAQILTAEMGKVIAEARGEIAYGANYIEWFAEETKRVYGDVIPPPSKDKRIVVVKQPIGVVACITPWNFPNAMLTRKIAPAIAAGCTVVCKPASATPLSAFAIAELAERAGFPPGVINVVAGSAGAIGGELTANPIVRKLTFTGSTEIGKVLEAECADTLKKTSMELGGNAPFIVFDDADLDAAVVGAMASKYRNAGQTCVCTNRFLVQDGVYDAFVEKLTAEVKKLTLGSGADNTVTTGPLIDAGAVDDVEKLVQDSIAAGATILLGGRRSDLGPGFFEPTLMTNVTNDMPIARNEIFGPVAPIIRFSTEDEAIAIANDTNVGLAAYFYTRDIGRVWRVSDELEYGIVGINEGIVSNEMAPFGGVKESGSGREGSKYGMDNYLEIRYMCLGGIDK